VQIIRNSARPATAAPANNFTGHVVMEPIIDAPAPSALRAVRVTFFPGARTHWHTHPLGQTLFVTQGEGRIALRGAQVETIRAGDTVWIPPDVEHWHGAGPGSLMIHIAMQEQPGGKGTVWLGAVSDADYDR
jgi:quercetin dioxygenase-like cupin family protein